MGWNVFVDWDKRASDEMFRDAISPLVEPALGSSKSTRTLELWLLQHGITVACAPALETDCQTRIAVNPNLVVGRLPVSSKIAILLHRWEADEKQRSETVLGADVEVMEPMRHGVIIKLYISNSASWWRA